MTARTRTLIPTLADLNETDNPGAYGGRCLSADGVGNTFWHFPSVDLVANRFEAEDGQVLWSDNVAGWNADPERDAVRPGRPVEIPGWLGELAREMGGVQVLAGELGVSASTVYRWGQGATPSGPAQRLLHQLRAQHLQPYHLDVYRVLEDTDDWPLIETLEGWTEQEVLDQANGKYPNAEDLEGSVHWTGCRR